ncbi:MAG: hypothetical protein GY710_04135 [Desulfobacteraceae bacterium]|nr:hypothetical protein [Desulfobacteraceae bacterium]
MKTKGKWVLIILSLYIMAGCGNLRNKFPVKNFYRIQAKSYMASMNTPGTGKGLLVKSFSISPEFETQAFVYRLSPTEFSTDFYNDFLISPARMITDVFREDLWDSSFFSQVQTPTIPDIRFQLGGKIINFYGDIQDIKHPQAVVTIRLILEKNTGDGFSQVINKNYEAQIKLDAPEPGALAIGLGKGIEQILNTFYRDITKAGVIPGPEKGK